MAGDALVEAFALATGIAQVGSSYTHRETGSASKAKTSDGDGVLDFGVADPERLLAPEPTDRRVQASELHQ